MGYRIIIALVVLVGMTACSEEPSQSQPSSTAPPAGTQAASPVDDAGDVAPNSTADSAGDYPLDVCVVSGEKLGSMGSPVEVEVEGRTVKLCCSACKPPLLADPAKYLAKLDASAAIPGNDGPSHDGHDHDGHNH
ncbi:MAG: hypothetical protein GVY16_12520 [Planctomycetes bacterium]|jgi:hypothetical protein|nr:hypothetical protein [Planctomycetota bacterium]